VDGIPVFNIGRRAVRKTARTLDGLRPARAVRRRHHRGPDAGIGLVVAITRGFRERHDPRETYPRTDRKAGSSGRTVQESSALGEGEDRHHAGADPQAGFVGVVSRSGTLTYEAVGQTSALGFGAVDLHRHRRRSDQRHELHRRPDALPRRPRDGGRRHDREIGGSAEEEAAAWIRANLKKPVVSFIAGRTAPPAADGHAARSSAAARDGREKVKALKDAGVHLPIRRAHRERR